jgi:hypothetical protein
MNRNMSLSSLAAAIKRNPAVKHYLHSENITEGIELTRVRQSIDRLKTELMMKIL